MATWADGKSIPRCTLTEPLIDDRNQGDLTRGEASREMLTKTLKSKDENNTLFGIAPLPFNTEPICEVSVLV